MSLTVKMPTAVARLPELFVLGRGIGTPHFGEEPPHRREVLKFHNHDQHRHDGSENGTDGEEKIGDND